MFFMLLVLPREPFVFKNNSKKLKLEVLFIVKTIKGPNQGGFMMLKILKNQNKVLRF
jgi:hypothetical protein